VVGFTNGTKEGPSKPNVWKVTTLDAHSWVEVRFPSYGWLTFDPTPGTATDSLSSVYSRPNVNTPNCRGSSTVAGNCTSVPVKGGQRRASGITQMGGRFNRIDEGPVGGGKPSIIKDPGQTAAGRGSLSARKVLLAGLLLGLLAFGFVPPVRRSRRRIRLRRAAGDHRRLILTTYDVFTQRAAELGCPRGPGETLEEYRSRLAGSELPVNGHLDRLTILAAMAAYAAGDPSDEDARAATDAADSAWRDMRKGTPLIRRVTGAYRRS
jgi:hypothetical protein